MYTDIANSSSSSSSSSKKENEKENKTKNNAERGQWHAACVLVSLLLQPLPSSCTTPKGISRQNAKNVFTTKPKRCDAMRRDATGARQQRLRLRRRRRALLCSLLVPLMDLQHFEWFISHVDEMDSNGPHFDVYCSSGKASKQQQQQQLPTACVVRMRAALCRQRSPEGRCT